MFKSDFDVQSESFLPRGTLDQLITKSSIQDALEFSDGDMVAEKELVDFILDQAKKVFATTVYCNVEGDNLVQTMRCFREHRVDDDQLPIKCPRTEAVDHGPIPACFTVHGNAAWRKKNMRMDFYRKQWHFLAPVFTSSTFKYVLPPNCILPFTWRARQVKGGSFGQVFEARIHEDHHDVLLHEDHSVATVAVKEILPDDEELQREVDRYWETELKALQEVSKLDHAHIVKFIAAFERGGKRYLLLKWANGGNLREYWDKYMWRGLHERMVEEALVQFEGLADGLFVLHNFNSADDGYRHGDLKPENILRCKSSSSSSSSSSSGESTGLGILKIADMGLAKRHPFATAARVKGTSTRFGTARYEPPEAMYSMALSRLYDIWSMGCILLEYLVWLLYGNEELKRFHETVRGGHAKDLPLWMTTPGEMGHTVSIRPQVISWMEHIARDPECRKESACRDLLDLVRSQLLVIPLDPNRGGTVNLQNNPESPRSLGGSQPGSSVPGVSIEGDTIKVQTREGPPYRADAKLFRNAMSRMVDRASRNRQYLYTGHPRTNLRGPTSMSNNPQSNLSPYDLRGMNRPQRQGLELPPPPAPNGSSLQVPGLRQPASIISSKDIAKDYAHPRYDDVWDFEIDNLFASKVHQSLSELGGSSNTSVSSKPSKICGRCAGLSFQRAGFRITDSVAALEKQSADCDLCRLMWHACSKFAVTTPTVTFERSQSKLLINCISYPPALSIIRSPGLRAEFPLQVGFARLPDCGQEAHFQVLRSWANDCDKNHSDCHPDVETSLPTRLIDVGLADASTVRLFETNKSGHKGRFIALSHPWGDQDKHPPFRALRVNYDSLCNGIPLSTLPMTFQDAIATTRALGVRYLWIDSICIVQGPDGDFNEQATLMEDVFSSAYCVIAASRAQGQHDGFLGPRRERKAVAIQKPGEEPFHVCEEIDDFAKDVLDGHLNTRAWVLQERALAKRTIFFTETQTYWECGAGVRCETLSKMKNARASFLGDPKFPMVAMASSHGSKIRLYQDLYAQYSRLSFTRIEDRPVAIRGLEKRLTQALNLYGGYGVFDDGPGKGMLPRSLVWQRGTEVASMTRISFPAHRYSSSSKDGACGGVVVPSWSWMAYSGGITYLDLPFSEVEWERTLRSPWAGFESATTIITGRSSSWSTTTTAAASWSTPVGELTGVARDFSLDRLQESESKIVFDSPGGTDGKKLKCVVVGKKKGLEPLKDRRHYVLVICSASVPTAGGLKVYERVGAGYLIGRSIKDGGETVRIH